jgi:hypothetical protein
LKFAIGFAIPNTPQEVQIAKVKNLYESNQALRREVRRRCKTKSSIFGFFLA